MTSRVCGTEELFSINCSHEKQHLRDGHLCGNRGQVCLTKAVCLSPVPGRTGFQNFYKVQIHGIG